MVKLPCKNALIYLNASLPIWRLISPWAAILLHFWKSPSSCQILFISFSIADRLDGMGAIRWVGCGIDVSVCSLQGPDDLNLLEYWVFFQHSITPVLHNSGFYQTIHSVSFAGPTDSQFILDNDASLILTNRLWWYISLRIANTSYIGYINCYFF